MVLADVAQSWRVFVTCEMLSFALSAVHAVHLVVFTTLGIDFPFWTTGTFAFLLCMMEQVPFLCAWLPGTSRARVLAVALSGFWVQLLSCILLGTNFVGVVHSAFLELHGLYYRADMAFLPANLLASISIVALSVALQAAATLAGLRYLLQRHYHAQHVALSRIATRGSRSDDELIVRNPTLDVRMTTFKDDESNNNNNNNNNNNYDQATTADDDKTTTVDDDTAVELPVEVVADSSGKQPTTTAARFLQMQWRRAVQAYMAATSDPDAREYDDISFRSEPCAGLCCCSLTGCRCCSLRGARSFRHYWTVRKWRILVVGLFLATTAGFVAGLVQMVRVLDPSGECARDDFACFAGDECQTIDGTACLLPFPSSFWLRDDPASATGFRVAVHPQAPPQIRLFGHLPVAAMNELDGFAVDGPLLFGFPNAVLRRFSAAANATNASASDASDDVRYTLYHDTIGLYQADNVTTVVVDMDGNPVPHWMEQDYMPDGDGLFLIYLARPLAFGTRFAVGIAGLRDSAGNVLPPSKGFRTLRDGDGASTGHPQAAHFEKHVFPALAKAGFAARSDLQLAWDFVTMSETISLDRAKAMTVTALQWAEAQGGITYRVVKVRDRGVDFCTQQPDRARTQYVRTVFGYMTVPTMKPRTYAATLPMRPDRANAYVRSQPDTLGFEVVTTEDVEFVVGIPCSVAVANDEGRGSNATDPFGGSTGKGAVAGLHFAHGMFGNRLKAIETKVPVAQRMQGIAYAIEQYGFSRFDRVTWIRTVLGVGVEYIPDLMLCGIVRNEMLEYLMRPQSPIFADPAIFGFAHLGGEPRRVVGQLQPGGSGELRRFFYGTSAGSITGGSFATASSFVSKAMLDVGGGPTALVAPRSLNFKTFIDVIARVTVYSHRDVIVAFAFLQQLTDLGGEAVVWGPRAAEMARTRQKQFLLQAAIGDLNVGQLASETLARAYGAVHLPDNIEDPTLFGVANGPSALMDDLLEDPQQDRLHNVFVQWRFVADDGRTFTGGAGPRNIAFAGRAPTRMHTGIAKQPAHVANTADFFTGSIDIGAQSDNCGDAICTITPTTAINRRSATMAADYDAIEAGANENDEDSGDGFIADFFPYLAWLDLLHSATPQE